MSVVAEFYSNGKKNKKLRTFNIVLWRSSVLEQITKWQENITVDNPIHNTIKSYFSSKYPHVQLL